MHGISSAFPRHLSMAMMDRVFFLVRRSTRCRCRCALSSSMPGVNSPNSTASAAATAVSNGIDGINDSASAVEVSKSNLVADNSMASAGDKSVVDVHAAVATPVETWNSSTGATAATTLSSEYDENVEMAATPVADGATAVQQTAVAVSRYELEH